MPGKLPPISIPVFFEHLLKFTSEQEEQFQKEVLVNNEALEPILGEVLDLLKKVKKVRNQPKKMVKHLSQMRTLAQEFYQGIQSVKLDNLTILCPLWMEVEKDRLDQQKGVTNILRLVEFKDEALPMIQALRKFCKSLPSPDEPWDRDLHLNRLHSLVAKAESEEVKHVLASLGSMIIGLKVLACVDMLNLTKIGFGIGFNNQSGTKSSPENDLLGTNAMRHEQSNKLWRYKIKWSGVLTTTMTHFLGATMESGVLELPQVLPSNDELFDRVLKAFDDFCEKVNKLTIQQLVFAFSFSVRVLMEACCRYVEGDDDSQKMIPFNQSILSGKFGKLRTNQPLTHQNLFSFNFMISDDFFKSSDDFNRIIQQSKFPFVNWIHMIQPHNDIMTQNFFRAYQSDWTVSDLAMFFAGCMGSAATGLETRNFAQLALRIARGQAPTPVQVKAQVKASSPTPAQVKTQVKASSPTPAQVKTQVKASSGLTWAARVAEPEHFSWADEDEDDDDDEDEDDDDDEHKGVENPVKVSAARVAETEPTKLATDETSKLLIVKDFCMAALNTMTRLSDPVTRLSEEEPFDMEKLLKLVQEKSTTATTEVSQV